MCKHSSNGDNSGIRRCSSSRNSTIDRHDVIEMRHEALSSSSLIVLIGVGYVFEDDIIRKSYPVV